MAQRKSTDIRAAILLAKKASSKKSSDRNDNSGGDSSATYAKTIKIEPTAQRMAARATAPAPDVNHMDTTDASASTVRMRNPVPTFREGEERERLKQERNGELRAARENSSSATASRHIVHSSMTAAAAAAAAAAGPTMGIDGDDDLGPEGAEAGSDDEGEEEIGTHVCIPAAQLQGCARDWPIVRWLNTAAAVCSSSRLCRRGTLYTLEPGVGL